MLPVSCFLWLPDPRNWTHPFMIVSLKKRHGFHDRGSILFCFKTRALQPGITMQGVQVRRLLKMQPLAGGECQSFAALRMAHPSPRLRTRRKRLPSFWFRVISGILNEPNCWRQLQPCVRNRFAFRPW